MDLSPGVKWLGMKLPTLICCIVWECTKRFPSSQICFHGMTLRTQQLLHLQRRVLINSDKRLWASSRLSAWRSAVSVTFVEFDTGHFHENLPRNSKFTTHCSFHCNNGYANVPQCYVMHTLPVLLHFAFHKLSWLKPKRVKKYWMLMVCLCTFYGVTVDQCSQNYIYICVCVCVCVCVRARVRIYIMCVMSVLGDHVVSAVTHVTNSQSAELESWREESVAYPDSGVCDQLNVYIAPWHESWSPPFLYHSRTLSLSFIRR